jgi:hypothetical protein
MKKTGLFCVLPNLKTKKVTHAPRVEMANSAILIGSDKIAGELLHHKSSKTINYYKKGV